MIPNMHYLSVLLLAIAPLTKAIIYPWYPSECPSCTKPKQCRNLGWDWAIYPNPITNNDENYPGFRADALKTQVPTFANVTTSSIGGLSALGVGRTLYGSSPTSPVINSSYFALNHHAYLWACENGIWQFDISAVDDLVLAWVGNVAYAGWTDENANARAVWRFAGTTHVGSASFKADLQGGTFVPLRFVFANGQGGGAFRLTITSPSGVMVHQTGRETGNDWVVRFGCPFGPWAPKFLAFGEEI